MAAYDGMSELIYIYYFGRLNPAVDKAVIKPLKSFILHINLLKESEVGGAGKSNKWKNFKGFQCVDLRYDLRIRFFFSSNKIFGASDE